MRHRRCAAAVVAASLLLALPGAAEPAIFADPWPVVGEAAELSVEIPSHSPFAPDDIGAGMPETAALVRYFPPVGADASRPAPAVVLLHGAAGVVEAREPTYARQLAAMGIGAAVVDVFRARRHIARGFTERIVEITETMALADAFATLAWLADRPEIDGSRVAIWGFSYGAMASILAANASVADRFAAAYSLGPARFAGHIAFYGPCIASFEDPVTTRAPVLMAWGSADELIDARRCATLAAELEQGGSSVRIEVYEGAYHQWDGSRNGPRRIGRLLDDCAFRVGRDLTIRDGSLGIPMAGPWTRRVMLGLCVGRDGYLIGRDDAVRAKSDRAVAEFLAKVFRVGGAE